MRATFGVDRGTGSPRPVSRTRFPGQWSSSAVSSGWRLKTLSSSCALCRRRLAVRPYSRRRTSHDVLDIWGRFEIGEDPAQSCHVVLDLAVGSAERTGGISADRVAGQPPGTAGQRQRERHEPDGEPVGDPDERCAGRLGLLDQPHHTRIG
jgi:hypothetical protein